MVEDDWLDVAKALLLVFELAPPIPRFQPAAFKLPQ